MDLARDLGAVLLTVEGTRHTAYLNAGIGCVDSIGNDYLINLNLPPEDLPLTVRPDRSLTHVEPDA